MISFNMIALREEIDERIEAAMDIANECPDILDEKTGRLKCPMNFHTPRGNLLGIIQRQQEQIDELRIRHELLWKRFEILKEECDKKL
jgi:hypothetical protein